MESPLNRPALLICASLVLGLGAPALAQGSPPAKKPAKKKKLTLNKEGSLKLVHKFLIALEKGQVKKALGMVKTPFLVMRGGKLLKLSGKELKKDFSGESGRQLGRRVVMFRKPHAKEMTALYWGPKSARAKKAAKRFPAFKGCGWVGVVYAGSKRKAEEAREPYAIKLVDKKLKIIARISPKPRNDVAALKKAEALAAKGKAAYKAFDTAERKGSGDAKAKHKEAVRLLSQALDAYNELLEPYRDKEGMLPPAYEGYEVALAELAQLLYDAEKRRTQ
ncbi:MAG: hypothetical protein JKY65_15230 [Planctomycetes bacterium]|nr:hypothetical protein [Planctomycetota bacterium]